MKLLAALFAVTLAAPAAFAQELEEAPGATTMDTAPPPSNDELNDAVNQLSHEKNTTPPPRPPSHSMNTPSPTRPKPVAKKFATATKKAVKKGAAKAKSAKKSKGKPKKKGKKH